MATGLFLPFLVLLITLVEMPDAAVVGDGAVLELQARQTARGENLLGPYSRFHFNHPGPIYFFLMLPLYYLSGQAHGSFFFTSVLINLAAVALIFLTIRRLSWLLFLGTATMLSSYLVHLGPGTLFSAWNPEITILPFGSAVFCLAAAVSGRPVFFFPAVAMLSFALQSHVAYAVPTVLIGLAAVGLFLFPVLVGNASKRRGDWRVTVGALLFLVLLWSPTIYEELASGDGNLSKAVSFFALGHEHKSADVALQVLKQRLSGFLLDGLGRSGIDSSIHLWLSLIVVFGLPVAWFFARRRGDALPASLSLFGLVGLGGALFSVTRIVGPVHEYLVGWISVLGLVGFTSIVMALASLVVGPAVRIHFGTNLVLVFLFSLMSLFNLRAAWVPLRLQEWTDIPVHRNTQRLSWKTIEWLRDKGAPEVEVRIVSGSTWPAAAGLILQLDKQRVQYCVENSWLFMFGAASACGGYTDEALIVGDTRLSQVLSNDDQFQSIVESSEGSVFFAKSLREPSVIDFSGPESLLYLRSGFAGLYEIEPGRGQWSLGSSSSIVLPLIPNRPYVLEISVRPFPISGRVQSMRVILNQQELTEFPMVERDITYVIPFPAEHVRGLNELRFEYAYAEPPMHHLEGSSDWRPLAVFFRRARITRGDTR